VVAAGDELWVFEPLDPAAYELDRHDVSLPGRLLKKAHHSRSASALHATLVQRVPPRGLLGLYRPSALVSRRPGAAAQLEQRGAASHLGLFEQPASFSAACLCASGGNGTTRRESPASGFGLRYAGARARPPPGADLSPGGARF
jgi:hypothetical protein